LDDKSMKSERERKLISQVFPVLDSSLVLITDQDTGGAAPISLFVFLAPYEWRIWLLFLATLITTSLIYYWLEGPVTQDKNSDNSSRFVEASTDVDSDKRSWYHSLYFTIQHCATIANLDPQTTPGRVLTASWSVFSIIFLAGYTANLANCLMAHREGTQEWNSINDVIEANARICVSRGTSGAYMDTNFPSYDKVIKQPQGTIYSVKDMVLNKNCEAAIVWKNTYEIAQEKQELNPDCKLHSIGAPLTTEGGGWMVYEDWTEYCTALIHQVLHVNLLAMTEDKTLHNIYEKHFIGAERTRKEACSQVGEETAEDNGNENSLTIRAMGGVFIVYSFLLIFAIVVSFLVAKPGGNPDGDPGVTS